MVVYAGIVTYNPELDRLRQSISAIAPQVGKVVVFDNGSANVDDISSLLFEFGKENELIRNCRNVGMASALNVLCQTAQSAQAEFILLLDQDSVVPEGFINSLIEYSGDDVGIVAPYIIDRNNVMNLPMDNVVESVKMAITSGSLVQLSAWESVGGYDENLFVDWVDHEFNDKLLLNGYRILRVQKAVLLHEIGKKEFSHMGWSFNLKKGLFRWPVYHDDRPFFRRYDVMKAHVYVTLKYRWTALWGHELWFLTYDVLRNLIRERRRFEFLRAFSKGIIDGTVLAHRAHARNGHSDVVVKR